MTVATVFHCMSQARTVMSKGEPAVWARGVPVLPLDVPGAALSPGSRTWSRAKGPAAAGAAAATSQPASHSRTNAMRALSRTITAPRCG